MNVFLIFIWMVYVFSVIEWIVAIVLVSCYVIKVGYGYWWVLVWGMVLVLVSVICVCIWYFFDNVS